MDVTERPFRNQIIFVLAEQKADCRVVAFFTQPFINSLDIEIEFPPAWTETCLPM